jgi:hypothetical protein
VAESETFGVESGFGEKAVEWINAEAKKHGKKFEARLYDYQVTTQNFGSFEMFSWIGDVNVARELIVKASSRFKIKVIEGSYKPKERIFKRHKSDYAMVRRGDKVIGHLEFEAPILGSSKWKLKTEERR